jgi:tetratricopeptide (TPR) repeat protein
MINRGEIMQPRMRKLPAIFLVAGLLCGAPASAQNSGTKNRQYGGTQEIFKLGVGARALGLGSAVVAMPLDASTVYWNPGGLDYLERRSVTMFYTPLLTIADTKYHYIGAAYPVLDLGTFGAGWMHWDIPGVVTRDDLGDQTGSFVSGEDAFLVSYAKQVRYGVSAGGTVKFRRQQIANNTARGFTGDIGLLYRPEFGEGVLQNMSLGFAVQNVIPLRMRPGSVTETIPYTLRGGLAKALRFGPRQDVVNIFAAFEKGQGAATRYNFGSEYVYQDLAMLRLGYNGKQPIFGGGVSYQMFQIDYAFGKYADEEGELGAQHRVSITVHFGKTKTQMYEEAQDRLFRQIEAETRKQATMSRRNDFDDKTNKGKTYFQQGDYFNAFLNFTQARDLMAGAYDIFTEPEKDDINVWVERAKNKMDEEAEAERQRLAQAAQETAVAEQTRAFIEEQTKKGMQNLQAGNYGEAIAEWQRGLERDPNNAQLKNLIAKTQGQMRERFAEQLREARALESKGDAVGAIRKYTQLMNEPSVSSADLKAYQDRIASLQKQLNNEQLFRQGYGEYLNKNDCSAKQFFSQALGQADRENPTLRQYYYDADARCNARLGPLPESIRQRFLEASSLIQNEQYEAALKILLEIQKQDRYNKRILDAIDLARERTNRKN